MMIIAGKGASLTNPQSFALKGSKNLVNGSQLLGSTSANLPTLKDVAKKDQLTASVP
jgi:hypothetical protein